MHADRPPRTSTIISVGRHNMFGHPAPTTIDVLRRYGATVYRTDEDAAVTVVANGALSGIDLKPCE